MNEINAIQIAEPSNWIRKLYSGIDVCEYVIVMCNVIYTNSNPFNHFQSLFKSLYSNQIRHLLSSMLSAEKKNVVQWFDLDTSGATQRIISSAEQQKKFSMRKLACFSLFIYIHMHTHAANWLKNAKSTFCTRTNWVLFAPSSM